MKKIVIAIRKAPSVAVSEKLRMAVGLTLEDDNQVTVALMDDGVWAATKIDPDLAGFETEKHIKTLTLMRHKVAVSMTAAKARGVDIEKEGLSPISGSGLIELFENADVVI